MSEMIEIHSEWVNMGEGVRRRVIADGESLMLVEVEFAPGAVVALHSHVHEQVSYIAKGRVRYTVGDRTTEYVAGQAVLLASNVKHGVAAMEDSTIIDSFSPPREDFRPKAGE
jgi:quercetin dioxygenase-like cupin family protein